MGGYLRISFWGELPDEGDFEKEHSILHNLKVREIILWGNSDNTSCQGPEECICICAYVHTRIYNGKPSISTHIHSISKYIHVYTCKYTDTDIIVFAHMRISRISRLLQIWLTTRTFSCVFCVFMHVPVHATSRYKRPCWSKFPPILGLTKIS